MKEAPDLLSLVEGVGAGLHLSNDGHVLEILQPILPGRYENLCEGVEKQTTQHSIRTVSWRELSELIEHVESIVIENSRQPIIKVPCKGSGLGEVNVKLVELTRGKVERGLSRQGLGC